MLPANFAFFKSSLGNFAAHNYFKIILSPIYLALLTKIPPTKYLIIWQSMQKEYLTHRNCMTVVKTVIREENKKNLLAKALVLTAQLF